MEHLATYGAATTREERRVAATEEALLQGTLSDLWSTWRLMRHIRSTKRVYDATGEVVRVGLDSAENGRGRVLEEKLVVADMAAGPSRKGPGH
ncbi:hypothetical protein F3Y22_tig00111088pilonHSYRG00387 [Hibiscus syriacus]|uniref:Uncharacterized protein n=1 Tax=Hibiscus syriacus TaxID=106335 RepID=A0A6A2Z4M7_HIBSY|nr:hypothetical protein F3Y22_tig00111088pilonHSYRG00387 [Hibiscus syriacus]